LPAGQVIREAGDKQCLERRLKGLRLVGQFEAIHVMVQPDIGHKQVNMGTAQDRQRFVRSRCTMDRKAGRRQNFREQAELIRVVLDDQHIQTAEVRRSVNGDNFSQGIFLEWMSNYVPRRVNQ